MAWMAPDAHRDVGDEGNGRARHALGHLASHVRGYRRRRWRFQSTDTFQAAETTK